MNRRKLLGCLLLLCLGTLFPVQGQVYILVDVTNDVAMAKNNDIHIAGFEGLEAISKKILHYQTWIAGFTTRLVTVFRPSKMARTISVLNRIGFMGASFQRQRRLCLLAGQPEFSSGCNPLRHPRLIRNLM